ncbi:hypothetical protein [Nocardioides sp. B-3]|uniref:hypothetical protein n=1 Tax=Nocardioides sp. B-3 TaxID=2895565 RepID=UPI0021524595|nr:hypothetical protein [Nocardioides sp. B-3]UUZ61151.1 hypothetical protein LP418_11310 [Nocardioides sp. B-3]
MQIIRGRVDDPSRLKAMLADTTSLHEMRPEILGGTLAIEPDGTFTETVCFTSEEAARQGEQIGAAGRGPQRARLRHAGRDVLRPAQAVVRERLNRAGGFRAHVGRETSVGPTP